MVFNLSLDLLSEQWLFDFGGIFLVHIRALGQTDHIGCNEENQIWEPSGPWMI